jgi:hypothetical protein
MWKTLPSVSIVALLVAACADSGVGPTRDASPTPLRQASFSTYDASTQTLGVAIGGPPHVDEPGTYTYWANVSGGTGPYTYQWFYSYCQNDIYECSDQLPVPNGTGNSVPVEIPEFVWKLHLVVHVYDSQTVPYAGEADLYVVNLSNEGGAGSGYKCDLGENFYPVPNFSVPPRHYRRNGCTGAKVYNPNGT